MDVENTIVLIIATGTIISFTLIKSIEVYITVLLIGLLIVAGVAGAFINPEVRTGLTYPIYFLLFAFLITVAKRVMEVLS